MSFNINNGIPERDLPVKSPSGAARVRYVDGDGKSYSSAMPDVIAASALVQDAIDGVVASADAEIGVIVNGMGYLPPVAFASGLNVDSSRFTVAYSGVTYAPVADAIPFTTTGTFNPAQWRVVQGVTAADLGASSGASLVGFKPGVSVDSALTAVVDPERIVPLYSTAAKTVYVNPVTGDDAADGGLSTPLRTIQEAVDRCPKYLRHRYTIDLVTAATLPVVYDEDVIVRGIHGEASPTSPVPTTNMLWIQGMGSDPDIAGGDSTQCRIGSFFATDCTGVATPSLRGVQAMRRTPYYEQAACFSVFSCNEAALENVSAVSGVACALVRAYASRVVVKKPNFDNCTNGVWAKRNAMASVSDARGQPSSNIYRFEENSYINIIRDGTTYTNPTLFFTTTGGILTDQPGNIYRLRGSFYGMPAIGSTLGVDTFAAGYLFNAPGVSGVCLGLNSELIGGSGVSIGSGAKVGAFASNVSVGAYALTTGARRATALGSAASAPFENSTAVGYNSATTAINQIKLGNGCSAVVDLDYETMQPGRGVIMKSPNGTRFRVRVTDAGVVETLAV